MRTILTWASKCCKYRQQRGLAAAGRPHEKGQFTASERQADALQGLHLPAPSPRNSQYRRPRSRERSRLEHSCRIDAHHLHDGGQRRDNAHDDGKQEQTQVRMGVIRMGSEVSAVSTTIIRLMQAASEKR